jgi:hypothetical protein
MSEPSRQLVSLLRTLTVELDLFGRSSHACTGCTRRTSGL